MIKFVSIVGAVTIAIIAFGAPAYAISFLLTDGYPDDKSFLIGAWAWGITESITLFAIIFWLKGVI